MKEFEDKIRSEDKKAPIEAAVATARGRRRRRQEAIEALIAGHACKAEPGLNSAASEEMYKASQEAGAGAGRGWPDGADGDAGGDEEVTDVDFEEVSEEK